MIKYKTKGKRELIVGVHALRVPRVPMENRIKGRRGSIVADLAPGTRFLYKKLDHSHKM